LAQASWMFLMERRVRREWSQSAKLWLKDAEVAKYMYRDSRERLRESMVALAERRAKHRQGAASTNALMAEAKQRVRELWDRLPEKDKVRRGVVKQFAVATVPKVP